MGAWWRCGNLRLGVLSGGGIGILGLGVLDKSTFWNLVQAEE
jgi:hypothetical protein